MPGVMGLTTEERFFAKVNKTETCWLWTAYIRPDGYGYFGMSNQKSKKALAHRVSWELARGPIPEGMVIDHVCHVRQCVNPGHLRLATLKQNAENLGVLNKNNSCGARGVTWDKINKKYRAQVYSAGKYVSVGRFPTFEEAAEAARRKRNELFTHNDVDRSTR